MKATKAQFARRKSFQRVVAATRWGVIRCTPFFGHIEIVPTQRTEGNKIIFGGYSIHYDMQGRETHRTPDIPTSVMTIN